MNFIIFLCILISLNLSLSSTNGIDLDCGYQNVIGLTATTSYDLDDKAQYGEFPWMVEILRQIYPFQLTEKSYVIIGGGALLTPKVVITAAHLIKEIASHYILARAGEWDRNTTNEQFPHQDRLVKRTIVHESFSLYGNSKYTNDIAFLLLETPFDFEEPNIRPVCLTTGVDELDYTSCYVNGWGKKTLQSPTSEMILKKIHLPIVPYNQCVQLWNKFVSPSITLDQTLMCAGGEQDVDVCVGDGGSPLVCLIKNTTNRYAIVGLVVNSQDCGMKDLPGLYTNIQHFGPWIYDKLGRLKEDFSSFLMLTD